MILVPVLTWLLRFNKRTNPPMWGTISRFPVKNFAVVILIAGAITFAGLSNLDELDKPITGSDQTPDNIPSMEAMVEYSNTFLEGRPHYSSSMHQSTLMKIVLTNKI